MNVTIFKEIEETPTDESEAKLDALARKEETNGLKLLCAVLGLLVAVPHVSALAVWLFLSAPFAILMVRYNRGLLLARVATAYGALLGLVYLVNDPMFAFTSDVGYIGKIIACAYVAYRLILYFLTAVLAERHEEELDTL